MATNALGGVKTGTVKGRPVEDSTWHLEPRTGITPADPVTCPYCGHHNPGATSFEDCPAKPLIGRPTPMLALLLVVLGLALGLAVAGPLR